MAGKYRGMLVFVGEGKGGNRPVEGAMDQNMSLSNQSELNQKWETICSGLRRDLGAQIYGQWIKPIKLSRFDSDNGELHLTFPSEFAANWVRDRYADRLTLAWQNHSPEVLKLTFSAKAGAARIAEVKQKNSQGMSGQNSLARVEKFRLDLDPRMTFEEFIPGRSNELALSAAQRVAAPEKPLFSPLYLQSSTGQGKTHLMHAIGHAYRAEFPGARIIYMSAERFMIEFVSAMRNNETMEFKASLREADLLMVDDIQFIVGKISTQEEFLHTIDALISQGKRVVVAADRPPQALDGVDQRL
jgi:chromosomal replication initiator protein